MQNPQNPGKFLMFFVKPQRREHRDSEVINVTPNWTAESIDSGNFLAELCAGYLCVCGVVNELIRLIKSGAFSKGWKH